MMVDFFGEVSLDLMGLCGGVASRSLGGLLNGDFSRGGELLR